MWSIKKISRWKELNMEYEKDIKMEGTE